MMSTASSVFTVRVSDDLKEKMLRYSVKWGEEVRGFIEARIRRLELAEAIKRVGKRAEGRRVKAGFPRA